MLEDFLIKHCSPTLAGLKIANLFSFPFTSKLDLSLTVDYLNAIINAKGVYIEVLRTNGKRALIFVYRKNLLANELRDKEISNFLASRGYSKNSVAYCIHHLKQAFLPPSSFPHEIGIFLGYPLDDVVGFINNNGKNSILSGFWKVYHNEYEALRLFKRYEKCVNVYNELYSKGQSISKLTVALN